MIPNRRPFHWMRCQCLKMHWQCFEMILKWICNAFWFRWKTLPTFQNKMEMFFNAFSMRWKCIATEKWYNAIFVKPGFPKGGHNCPSIRRWQVSRSMFKKWLKCRGRCLSFPKDVLGIFRGIIWDVIGCFRYRCSTISVSLNAGAKVLQLQARWQEHNISVYA